MNLWPFIEAEKAGHHGVKRDCELLEVSRAAYYEWSAHIPTTRQVSDAELMDKIKVIHAESNGTYGAPASTPSCVGTASTAERSGSPASWWAPAWPGAAPSDGERRPSPMPTPNPGPSISSSGSLGPTSISTTRWCGDIAYIC